MTSSRERETLCLQLLPLLLAHAVRYCLTVRGYRALKAAGTIGCLKFAGRQNFGTSHRQR